MLRPYWSIMGPHWSYAACSDQVQSRPTRVMELWVWLGRDPTSQYSKQMENVQTMNHLLAFEFDRKLKPSHAVGVPQVHGFCDGGEKAYSAVILLHWEFVNGSYKCVPVLIMSFVAPSKTKSVPRLELMGCLRAILRESEAKLEIKNFNPPSFFVWR